MTTFNLTFAKALQNSLMPETATITTQADDGSTTTTSASCRITSPTSPDERVIAERFTGVTAYVLTFAATTTITEQAKVAISGRTFGVVAVMRTSFDTARRVIAVEVK